MKKFWIQIAILLIVILGALYSGTNPSWWSALLGNTTGSQNTATNSNSTIGIRQIKINQTIINIEVADTVEKRTKGLGGRDFLASDQGMLFVFPEEKKYRFWMKGMKIPLDFIFIRRGRVVDLLQSVPPPDINQTDQTLPVYEPVVPIDMLLEVNSGFVNTQNIRVGDTVTLVE